MRFADSDVVRHDLVRRIVTAYEQRPRPALEDRRPTMSALPVIDIAVESTLWEEAPDVYGWAAAAIGEAVLKSGVKLKPGAEISLLLCRRRGDPQAQCAMAGQGPADQRAFLPGARRGRDAPALGDIAIAYETCAREAEAEHKSFRAHVTHLVAHGFLHLIGFDHEEEAQALRMEALEREILAALGIRDPYAAFVTDIE